MGSSLRLFWAGLSVLALGVASCSSTTLPLGVDGGGGAGGPTDGPKTDGAKTDGATTDGAKSDAMDARGPDLNVPPPAMLTATVLDRRATTFELLWTAPSAGGAAVSGYQVRYAKVPITAANFEDTTMTTAVPYTGTPKAPGETDGMIVKAYIENGYYFAVIGTDSGGTNVGTLMATTAAVAAHFNVTLVSSPSGTNQSFGASLDGSGDVNGDGISDLLVGTFSDNHAYLFFGGSTFAPTAPAVTFTGTNVGFGSTVRQIGDIDGDGMPDIAIADRPTGLQVFIYKGRVTWPMTLTDAQADYVITTDATYAASQFGSAIEGLGDFNGDGVADFAISAPLYNSRVGRVLVVDGRTGFTSFTAPSTTRALEIGADPVLARTQLGVGLAGLGHFYSVTTGTTLAVSAPGLPVQPSDNAGRIYAFHGRAPGAAIAVTSADNTVVGSAAGALIGNQLANLGHLTSAVSSLGSSNLSDAVSVAGTTGTAFILSGTATTGPVASSVVVYETGTTLPGQTLFGGGFSGTDSVVSLIGNATADFAISGQVGGTLDIVDGSKLSSLTSPINTTTAADVHVPMPSGWGGTIGGARNLIKDINGDGYPDFALGDVFGTVPGRVAVFW